MKSLKKLSAFLFAIVLGASLMALPTLAFADMAYDDDVAANLTAESFVSDEGNLLSSSEISSLNAMGRDILESHDVAVYYVTVDSLDEYTTAESYTDKFIDTYDLAGKAPNGCAVCLVCLPASQFSLMSAGDVQDTLTSQMLDYLVDEINPYLGRSDWAGAGETFFGDVGQVLSGKTPNATSEVSYNGTYVTDDYGLFDDSQRMQLEATATELAQKYNMGVYLLVVDYMQDSNGNNLSSPSTTERTNFATSFYRAHDLGLGSGKDGIMLVLAVDSRDYVTIAYGQGSHSFSDEGIEAMESAVTECLGDDDWFEGCDTYYTKTGEQLEYYSVKGEPWTEPDLLSLLLKILAALGIPAGVAGSMVSREKSAMKTAQEKTEADNYLVPGSFSLTHATDTFVNTSLSVVPIPKHEDNDSDGGGFGGGGWGGGGGGGFSSSGGGKF